MKGVWQLAEHQPSTLQEPSSSGTQVFRVSKAYVTVRLKLLLNFDACCSLMSTSQFLGENHIGGFECYSHFRELDERLT